jgi:hypothetical protein
MEMFIAGPELALNSVDRLQLDLIFAKWLALEQITRVVMRFAISPATSIRIICTDSTLTLSLASLRVSLYEVLTLCYLTNFSVAFICITRVCDIAVLVHNAIHAR